MSEDVIIKRNTLLAEQVALGLPDEPPTLKSKKKPAYHVMCIEKERHAATTSESYAQILKRDTDSFLSGGAQYINSLLAATFHTKPKSELTPRERYERYRLMWERQKKGYTPKWARKLQRIIGFIDDINDGLVTAAYLCRLAGYLCPPAAEVAFTASGIFTAGAMLTDGVNFLLSLPLGPHGLKIVMENEAFNISELSLKSLTKLKMGVGPLPTIGEALQIAQTTDRLFGVGISLGPIMGELSEAWFMLIRSIEAPFKRLAHYVHPIIHWTKSQIKGIFSPFLEKKRRPHPRKAERVVIEKWPRWRKGHSPPEIEYIDCGLEGHFRPPYNYEFWMMKLFSSSFEMLCYPDHYWEDWAWQAIQGILISTPFVIHYLSSIDFPILLDWILKQEVPQYPMHRPETRDQLYYLGIDPHELTYPVIPYFEEGMTFEDAIHASYETIMTKLTELKYFPPETKEAGQLNVAMSVVAHELMWLFAEDDAEIQTNHGGPMKSLLLLANYRLLPPENTPPDKIAVVVNRILDYHRANQTYPTWSTVYSWCMEQWGGVRRS